MTREQETMLLAPFSAEEVQWRLRNSNENGGYAVPYLDSRAVQNRLDEVLGKENWQNTFAAVPTGNQKDPTATVCAVSIFYPDRNEWISKSDGAGASDIEPVKGGLSDAFKRAASMWGVGRYMYRLSDQWVDIETKGKSKVIARAAYPKLNAYYEKAVKGIFGTKPPESPKQSSGLPDSVNDTPAAKGPPAFYTIQTATLNKGAKGDNTALTLLKPDGKTVTAYIQGDPGLKSGQRIAHVKAAEQNHPAAGKYYVISEYELVAA